METVRNDVTAFGCLHDEREPVYEIEAAGAVRRHHADALRANRNENPAEGEDTDGAKDENPNRGPARILAEYQPPNAVRHATMIILFAQLVRGYEARHRRNVNRVLLALAGVDGEAAMHAAFGEL